MLGSKVVIFGINTSGNDPRTVGCLRIPTTFQNQPEEWRQPWCGCIDFCATSNQIGLSGDHLQVGRSHDCWDESGAGIWLPMRIVLLSFVLALGKSLSGRYITVLAYFNDLWEPWTRRGGCVNGRPFFRFCSERAPPPTKPPTSPVPIISYLDIVVSALSMGATKWRIVPVS